jgi:serine/threonine protein kinase
MPLPTGSRLGPYEIQSALGTTGVGEVYKARDTRLDRTVAIKILPDSLAADPQFRERFEREARAISQFTHPHICTLFDVGEQAATAFLVMESLEGETLEQRLKKGPLPTADALRLAIQIADALSSAHRHGGHGAGQYVHGPGRRSGTTMSFHCGAGRADRRAFQFDHRRRPRHDD